MTLHTSLFVLLAIWSCVALGGPVAAQPADEGHDVREMRRFIEERQPEGENGWPLIEEVVSDLKSIEGEFAPGTVDWESVYRTDWFADPGDELIIRQTRLALERAKEAGVHQKVFDAAACGRLVMPIRSDALFDFAQIDNGADIRYLSRFMTAVAQDAIEGGDEQAFAAATNGALFLAWGLSQHPSFVSLLSSSAIERFVYELMQRHLIEVGVTPATLKELLSSVDRWALRSIKDHIRNETHVAMAHLRSACGEDDPAELDEIEREHREALTHLLPLADLPPTEWPTLDLEHDEDDPLGEVVQVMVEGHVKIMGRDAMHRVYRQGMRIMLALELHKRERGRYPKALDALAPQLLPQVPSDPYTGQPFSYRRSSEPDGSDSYILYSFGANNTDNGGKPCLIPHRAWRRGDGDPGCDFILNERWRH